MSTLEEGYEDLTRFGLSPAEIDELCQAQNECVFNWSTKDGWPVGVIMSFVRKPDGRIWLTCARRRKRVPAVLRDPRVSIVISSVGTALGPSKTVTFKGTCKVHGPEDADFDELKGWFYPGLVDVIFRAMPAPEDFKAAFLANLDSPDRVVLEVETSGTITYDGQKMSAATIEALVQ